MSYAPRRPSISKATRARIFERDGGRCHLCGQKIASGDPWQADHVLARELGGSDDEANLRPAHVDCHREKSKADVKLIAKSNRIRRKHGPVELRKHKKPIPRPKNYVWPSRPFQKRQKSQR